MELLKLETRRERTKQMEVLGFSMKYNYAEYDIRKIYTSADRPYMQPLQIREKTYT